VSSAPSLPGEAPTVALEAPRQAAPQLTGRQKAAMLFVSLGHDVAAGIMKHLHDEEIEQLSLEMARTGQIRPTEMSSVYQEVDETLLAWSGFAEGGFGFAREVLEKSVGDDRATEILGRLSAVIEMRPFEFLRRTPPEQIAAFLRNEGPQTVALTIANLHTTLAAQVLALLPAEEQPDVAVRIARMTETRPEVIKEVEAVVRQKLSAVISQEYAASGGVQSLVDILNHADRPTERNILETLGDADEDLAEEVRKLLFVFEDIVKLDDRSIQLVLREVETKDLALALRGVSDEVKDRIMANMSQRGAEMLREEMEYTPPQPRRVVEEAQGKVVAVLRRLEEAGAITIGRGTEDELVG
jgi:flagellar motor switch protein FliG